MTLYDYQQELVDEALPILDQYGIVYLALYQRTGKTPISLSVANMEGSQDVLFVTVSFSTINYITINSKIYICKIKVTVLYV